MLAKNVLGIIILVLNIAGLGYVVYMAGLILIHHFFPKEVAEQETNAAPRTQKTPVIIDEDIIPDEDNLLKDMDLSDLDNLNLDDFE